MAIQIVTAYHYDAQGYYIGPDQAMDGMLPDDDTMTAPHLQEGYWAKWNGKKWVNEKKPASCAEAVAAGLSCVSNAPDLHSREVKELIEALVQAESESYKVVSDSATMEMHIEPIPEPTPEEEEIKRDEEKAAAYAAAIADLKEQMTTAQMLGDAEWIAEIQAEYQELLEEE